MFDTTHRDFAVLSIGVYYSLGNILQPGLALAVIPMKISINLPLGLELNSWRLFLLLTSLPSLLSGIATAFCVESPKFLLDQGRKEEALNVFKKIYTINTGLPSNTYPVKRLHKDSLVVGNNTDKKGCASVLRVLLQQTSSLFKPPHRNIALISFFIQFSLLSVVNLVRLWMPQLFAEMYTRETKNNTRENSLCDILSLNENEENLSESCREVEIHSTVYLNVMIVFGACGVICLLINILVKFLEKQKLLFATVSVPALCLFLIPTLSTAYVVPLASIAISLLNGYFYLFISLIVDLFPTNLRATAVSLSLMFGRIGLIIATLGLTKLLYIQCNMVFYILGSIVIDMGPKIHSLHLK